MLSVSCVFRNHIGFPFDFLNSTSLFFHLLSIHVIKFISFVGKLIGLGSDGASNMTGKKGELATLLKLDVNRELLNVHCFAHRLELAFRYCLKKYKL